MNEIISIIPARGGSKGIPRKNIVSLAGKPLIAYSIEYSLACPLISRTIVSTDDPQIAQIARDFGAETPFMRPAELAQDDTQDFPVFLHCLQWLEENENFTPEMVVQLRPTSPLRPPGLIEQAVDWMRENPEADCLRTIVESPITPYKTWVMHGNYLKPFVQLAGRESYNMPRQDLPKVYWHNGVIDVIRSKTILRKNTISGDKILPLLMDGKFITVDIDTPFDLLIAECAIQKNKEADYGNV